MTTLKRAYRTPVYRFGLLNSRQNERVDHAQEHFAYEEFPDPRAPLGLNYIIHPLSIDNTKHMPEETLKSLKNHLKSTLKDYGNPLATQDGGQEAFPRLRLRSLVTLCWALHTFTDLDLDVQTELFGEKMLSDLVQDDWKVDGEGNILDQNSMKRWDAKGKELR